MCMCMYGYIDSVSASALGEVGDVGTHVQIHLLLL